MKKISDLIKIIELLNEDDKSETNNMWEIGKSYFIRTVTMHLTGKLIAITDKELLLSDAAWIADSGRFYNALQSGCFDEIEPFVNNVIVNRNSIIDATIWSHALPNQQK